jgi:hypothetical protein
VDQSLRAWLVVAEMPSSQTATILLKLATTEFGGFGD